MDHDMSDATSWCQAQWAARSHAGQAGRKRPDCPGSAARTGVSPFHREGNGSVQATVRGPDVTASPPSN